MEKIEAKHVKFIKLGHGGEWEKECISSGIIKFGYSATPHDICMSGNWDEVYQLWLSIRGDKGATTRDIEQIKTFYTCDSDTLFITFYGGFLYWCQPTGKVNLLDDGNRERKTINGWHNYSVSGDKLNIYKLSGQLLKVQGFRGTICNVDVANYVILKINNKKSPEVIASIEAEKTYIFTIINLCKLLTWQDFELLVDLIFSTSGWRRNSVLGKTQKTIDLELTLPTTSENAFVQIKSKADINSLRDYENQFRNSNAYNRMFFVWHSGPLKEDHKDINGITLIGPYKLAEMILDSGLSRWLRNKVA